MKVFISWSGQSSAAVADALRYWLPKVIQSLDKEFVRGLFIEQTGSALGLDRPSEVQTDNKPHKAPVEDPEKHENSNP